MFPRVLKHYITLHYITMVFCNWHCIYISITWSHTTKLWNENKYHSRLIIDLFPVVRFTLLTVDCATSSLPLASFHLCSIRQLLHVKGKEGDCPVTSTLQTRGVLEKLVSVGFTEYAWGNYSLHTENAFKPFVLVVYDVWLNVLSLWEGYQWELDACRICLWKCVGVWLT